MKEPIKKTGFALSYPGRLTPQARAAPDGGGNANEERDHAFRKAIVAIPPGKVSTYGGVAAAAGYPRHHRAVARLLRTDHLDKLPWHRVIGADGQIKTAGTAAKEQRTRLRLEGVKFNGNRVDLDKCLFHPNQGSLRVPRE